jgi:hypothetical protein
LSSAIVIVRAVQSRRRLTRDAGERVGLLDLPDELLAAAVAHLPEDDEFAAALTRARLRKAVALSEERRRKSLARTSTSTGSVFRSLAKLQWAISSGLPIDSIHSQFARKAQLGPREHVRVLLDSLPRLPLTRLKIYLTELNLSYNEIGDAGVVSLAKALEVNATLTTLWLIENQIGDTGACSLSNALEVNATLTKLNLSHNCIGDPGAIGLSKALEVNTTLAILSLFDIRIGDAGAVGFTKAVEANARLTNLYLRFNELGSASTSAIRTAWQSRPGRLLL